MSTPKDARPARPEYGEYATPEEQAAQRGTPAVVVPSPAERPPAASTVLPGRPPRAGDRLASQLLLLLGALGLGLTLNMAFGLDAGMQKIYEYYNIDGEFVPSPLTRIAQYVIGVSSIALYLWALFGTRLAQRRGRRSVWIPLVAGAVAWIVVIVTFAVVELNDPNLYAAILKQAGGIG